MSIYTITDGRITVSLCDLGAELVSVTDEDGMERIWQADPQVWGRHAPNLFPVIGRLRDSMYCWNDTDCSIPTHGFARDSRFTLIRQRPDAVTFLLEDSPETRTVFPFAFTLELEYSVAGGVLTKTCRVTNRTHGEMPFEFGGHDGYRTALLPGETMDDYYLEFEGMDVISPRVMEEGTCFVTDACVEIPLEDHRWFTYRDWFRTMDTAVLDRLPVNRVTLGSVNHEKRVTVTFEDFDYLGLWTAQPEGDSGYLCIEPWSALPECTFTGPDLRSKPGMIVLRPKETRALTYTMAF